MFQTETLTHLTDIPDEHYRYGCQVCCVEDNIYLVGGDIRVTEYNPRTNTWRNMPSLQNARYGLSVCTLDNKIFVLDSDGSAATTCEMLDLSDDDPQWKYIARMNSSHCSDAVVIERKIYVLGGESVEVYDVDQGKLMEYLQIINFDIYRSVEICSQHAN